MAHDASGDTLLSVATDIQLADLVKVFVRNITLTPTLMAKAVDQDGTSDLDGKMDGKSIKGLIAAGLKITSTADLNIKLEYRDTFLHTAIQANCLKELMYAFDFGVKITEEMLMAHDSNGNTLLYTAAIEKNQLADLVKIFPRNIISTPTLMAKVVNKHGTSALEYARQDIAKLIKAGLKVSSVADLEIQSKSGETLLHSAIKQNCLKELIGKYNYDVKITAEMLMEPIFHGVMQRDGFSLENVRRSFADIGMIITEEMLSKMLTQSNSKGDTIFHIAMQRGYQFFDNVCKSLAETRIIITEAMLMKWAHI